MTRPIKPRTHYGAEIEALLRLRRIVQLDPREEWKRSATENIDSLVALLARLPSPVASTNA